MSAPISRQLAVVVAYIMRKRQGHDEEIEFSSLNFEKLSGISRKYEKQLIHAVYLSKKCIKIMMGAACITSNILVDKYLYIYH